MINEINFSALHPQTANNSPWKSLRQALLLTALLFLIFGPILYITESDINTQNFILGIFQVVFVVIMVLAMYKLLMRKFHKQRAVMHQFANQNGWQFEGYKRLQDDTATPVGWGFSGRWHSQIYRVIGTVGASNFELYALGGIVKTSALASVINIVTQPIIHRRYTLGYRTVILTRTLCNTATLPPAIQVISEGGWNYILMNGNAFTDTEMQAMFEPLIIPA